MQLPARETAWTPWLTRKVSVFLNVYVHLVWGWRCGRDVHICTSIVLHIKWKIKPAHTLIQKREHFSLWQKQDCFLFTPTKHPNKIMSWQESLITLVLTCLSEMGTFSSDLVLICPDLPRCWDRAWKSVFWSGPSWGSSAFVISTWS